MAVVSSTGFGDGIYPVYAAIADCGELGQRVAALMVDFDLGVQRESFLKLCMAGSKPEPGSGGVSAEAEKRASGAIINATQGAAVIFTDQDGTMAYFYNYLIADREVKVCFCPSYDPDRRASAFSVCLFINGDMIAADHGATWEQAMGYVLAVLSAQTPEEAAGRYGELHPRFTADELIGRVRNPNWASELAKQAAA